MQTTITEIAHDVFPLDVRIRLRLQVNHSGP